jgi:hypothetical protein
MRHRLSASLWGAADDEPLDEGPLRLSGRLRALVRAPATSKTLTPLPSLLGVYRRDRQMVARRSRSVTSAMSPLAPMRLSLARDHATTDATFPPTPKKGAPPYAARRCGDCFISMLTLPPSASHATGGSARRLARIPPAAQSHRRRRAPHAPRSPRLRRHPTRCPAASSRC